MKQKSYYQFSLKREIEKHKKDRQAESLKH
jgi:hypothetical protein